MEITGERKVEQRREGHPCRCSRFLASSHPRFLAFRTVAVPAAAGLKTAIPAIPAIHLAAIHLAAIARLGVYAHLASVDSPARPAQPAQPAHEPAVGRACAHPLPHTTPTLQSVQCMQSQSQSQSVEPVVQR